MEPNLGQGACQAIEDAVALGAAARGRPTEAILAPYEHLCLAPVASTVRRGAEGKYGAHGPLATQWIARAILRSMPARIGDSMARSIQTMPSYDRRRRSRAAPMPNAARD